MNQFTELSNQVLRFAVSDGGVWVTAWIAIALTIGLLILIMTQVTHSDRPVATIADLEAATVPVIRRHSRRGGVHPVDMDATVVLAELPTSHWATGTEWHDSQHPTDAPATGRHHAENPARTIVPSDWRPPIGGIRIALLETPTAQYAIVRRERSNVTRPYVVGSTA